MYLYACAQNKEMAKSEARHVIRLIKGKNPTFGVWYDVEDARLLKSADLVPICKTWCDAIKDAGNACVGIYASVSVMKDRLDSPELDKYEKWVAQWEHSCDYPNPGIWQFTSHGKLNGQVFDMDYAYKDYPNMPGDDMTHHVLYRVTPIYEGNNLLANGLLMEAYSVEDDGAGVCFCNYVYNVQPNIDIDYSTGESSVSADAPSPTPEPSSVPTPEPEQEKEQDSIGVDYIANTNTRKFHYPTCSSVDNMKDSNKLPFTGSRDDLIAQGFEPCKRCDP